MQLCRYIITPGAALLLLLVNLACSVKEERGECPCVLSVFPDLSIEAKAYRRISNLFIIREAESGYRLHNGELKLTAFTEGKPVKVNLPKTEVTLNGIFGIRTMDEDGTVLRIENGRQSDSIYVYNSRIDCTGETAADTLRLSKQWCTMRISVTKSEEWQPEACRISSQWNGLDLSTMQAMKGLFSFSAVRIKNDSYIVRLPRQGDDSMTLQLDFKDGLSSSYPIGILISEAGYNWSKASLDDIIVFIDRTDISVNTLVSEWDEGYDYGNIEI